MKVKKAVSGGGPHLQPWVAVTRIVNRRLLTTGRSRTDGSRAQHIEQSTAESSVVAIFQTKIAVF